MADVDIHSVQFPGFLTFSHCLLFSLWFLLWLCWKTTSIGASYTLPGIFCPVFSPRLSPSFLISLADSHLSMSTSNTWSGANFQRLLQFVSNLLVIVSFLYSVYSGICVRKYILGWLIPPRLIFAAGWWLPAALCSIFVWRAIFENKFCLWYKSGC